MSPPSEPGLILHGGGGTWSEDDRASARDGLLRATRRGRRLLVEGRSALEVAVETVAVLEDDPTFNAGTGSVLNLAGEVQMDASVMQGSTRCFGGVTNLKNVRNPVRVARAVMDETDHVLLGGEGAKRFAAALGFEEHDPATDSARAMYEQRRESLENKDPQGFHRLNELLDRYPQLRGNTVGAAVLDVEGQLAAATSTGGLTLQLPGRIGDSPLPGAGTYATKNAAASATGRGELIARALSTRDLCDRIETDTAPSEAARNTLHGMRQSVGDHAGVIAIDRSGRTGAAHGTPHLPHAMTTLDQSDPVYRLEVEGESRR